MSDVVVKPSSIHGWGLFAARDFKGGQRILERRQREITPENPLREALGEKAYHCDYLAGGKVVLLGWPERHLNHCCEPNACVRQIGDTHCICARRDIRTGQEITEDYCINSRGDTVWTCNCGSPQCRHTIHSDFFRLPPAKQREYLPLLNPWFIGENRELVERLEKTVQR